MSELGPSSDVLADLGRIEALVGEMLRAGRVPVLAVGVVPIVELGAVRVAVFGEAGGVQEPGWEGWLPEDLARELTQRHAALRQAAWDADHAFDWSVAWTEDTGSTVVWTAEGARLRVVDGTIDVLDQGRWTIVPTGRIARITLSRVHPHPAGVDHGVIRLHTTDGRQVPLLAGRMIAAGLVARHLAAVLGVAWTTSRWDP